MRFNFLRVNWIQFAALIALRWTADTSVCRGFVTVQKGKFSLARISHSTNAIIKPQQKIDGSREIEEAMKKVKEAQSLITAAIDPGEQAPHSVLLQNNADKNTNSWRNTLYCFRNINWKASKIFWRWDSYSLWHLRHVVTGNLKINIVWHLCLLQILRKSGESVGLAHALADDTPGLEEDVLGQDLVAGNLAPGPFFSTTFCYKFAPVYWCVCRTVLWCED